MFDLTKLDTRTKSENGSEFEIIDPTNGNKTGIIVTVYGPDSKQYYLAEREAQKKVAESKENEDRFAVISRAKAEFLAAVTIDISGAMIGEKEVEREDWVDFYMVPIISDQVNAFITNRVNFF